MDISERITRTDVAHQAGVSKAVVSAVVNDRAEGLGIARGTVERVLRTIGDIDYVPRAQASAVARGRSDGLGMLGDVSQPLYDECLRQGRDAGWFPAASLAVDEASLRTEHAQGRFDAYIVLPGCPFHADGVPLVRIDREVGWDSTTAARLAWERIGSGECLVLLPDPCGGELAAVDQALEDLAGEHLARLPLPTGRLGVMDGALAGACQAEPILDTVPVLALGDACAWAAARRWPERLRRPDNGSPLLPVAVSAMVDLLRWLPGIPLPWSDIAQAAVSLAGHRCDGRCAPPELPVPARLIDLRATRPS